MIAVVSALPIELSEFHENYSVRKPGMDFTIHTDTPNVCYMALGVGKVMAASSIQFLIDRYRSELTEIILVGYCGCIPKYFDIKGVNIHSAGHVGDVVVVNRSFQYMCDIDKLHKSVLYSVNARNPYELMTCDYRLMTDLLSYQADGTQCFRMTIDDMLSDDVFMTNHGIIKYKDVLDTLKFRFIDMETAAVAYVCSRNKIPFCSIKTVSDLCDENSEEAYKPDSKLVTNHAALAVRYYLIKKGIHVYTPPRNIK